MTTDSDVPMPPPVDNEPLESNAPTRRWLIPVASLGYLGFAPASGTVAVAVVGIPLHLLLVVGLKVSWPVYVAVTLAWTLAAIWIAGEADRAFGEKDSRKSVVDEIPGYLIALIGIPITWQTIAAAFFLERILDIAKVPPANWIERRVPGGWGVVLDDVVAGIYSLLLLHLAIRLFPGILGFAVSA